MLLGIYENLKLIVKLLGGCGHSGHGILKVAVQYFKRNRWNKRIFCMFSCTKSGKLNTISINCGWEWSKLGVGL